MKPYWIRQSEITGRHEISGPGVRCTMDDLSSHDKLVHIVDHLKSARREAIRRTNRDAAIPEVTFEREQNGFHRFKGPGLPDAGATLCTDPKRRTEPETLVFLLNMVYDGTSRMAYSQLLAKELRDQPLQMVTRKVPSCEKETLSTNAAIRIMCDAHHLGIALSPLHRYALILLMQGDMTQAMEAMELSNTRKNNGATAQ